MCQWASVHWPEAGRYSTDCCKITPSPLLSLPPSPSYTQARAHTHTHFTKQWLFFWCIPELIKIPDPSKDEVNEVTSSSLTALRFSYRTKGKTLMLSYMFTFPLYLVTSLLMCSCCCWRSSHKWPLFSSYQHYHQSNSYLLWNVNGLYNKKKNIKKARYD